ncbi:MAG: aminoglycoside N(3)-acetyltransferase [Petrotogales bacterium]
MSEKEAILNSDVPITKDRLKDDLKKLGLKKGLTIIVHSSLQSMGWVCGGAVTAIKALEEVLTETGTLVMPTHSSDYSEPSDWSHPPVPESWWKIIRDNMPAYDPSVTPTRGMGIIPETFRKQKDVLRSEHPMDSFAARGKHARYITENHELPYSLGPDSPLGKLYKLKAWILLLGVDHAKNTSLHLAEYLADYPSKKLIKQGAPVKINGKRKWVTFDDIDISSDDFEVLGSAFEKQMPHLVRKGKVGIAESKMIPQKALVDFSIEWFSNNRKGSTNE